MHLKHGVPKIILAVTLAAVCVGCAPGQSSMEQQVQEMRTLYQTMESMEGTGTFQADYTDRVYEYEVTLAGNRREGTLTVTAPENISGTVIAWSEDALTLETDGVVLETGALSEDGFSPADAVPAVLSACQSGMLLSCSEETTGEETLLYAAFQNPDSERSTVECYFNPETYALRKAEVAEDGRTVVTLELSAFQMILAGRE